MDEQLLEVLEQMIDGRNDFFIRTAQLTPHQSRPAVLSRYMMNEIVYLEMINRIYQNHIRNQLATTVLTMTLPSNFLDPVAVVPSEANVTAALEDIESSTTNCAICQESISSGGARIRHCGHVFHRSCIVNWLGMSVRCPVCRHDIRQEGRANQTPSASEQTSSQQEDQ
jgi:hypothetical protein